MFVSGLSASKIIEFKKGCRKKIASSKGTSQKRSRISKRGGRFSKRVPPILETDLEGISPKETPTKQTENVDDFTADIMCSSEDNWVDEMDSDGPLVWPSDQKKKTGMSPVIFSTFHLGKMFSTSPISVPRKAVSQFHLL